MAYGRSVEAANIGASFDEYKGDPILGGAEGKPVEISLEPFQQLAGFVNLRNKAFWEQKQKNALLLANDIGATLEQYDLSLLDESDRNKMKGELEKTIGEFQKMARDGEVTASPNLLIDYQLKKNKLIGETTQRYNMAKARSIAKKLNEEQIRTAYANNPELQKVQLDALNKEVKDTDVTHQISPLIAWKPKDITIGTAVARDVKSGVFGGAKDVLAETKIFVPKDQDASVSQMVLGLKSIKGIPKTITDENGNQIPNPEYAIQQAAPETEGTLWGEMAGVFNDVAGKYINKETGNFDATTFSSNNKGLAPIYQDIEAYNEYLRDHAAVAMKGGFEIKGTGINLPNQVSASDFTDYIIDVSKGVSDQDLARVALWKRFQGDQIVNAKIDRHNTDLERAVKAAQLENQRLDAQQKRLLVDKLKNGKVPTTKGGTLNISNLSAPVKQFVEFVSKATGTIRNRGYKGVVAIPYGQISNLHLEALGIKHENMDKIAKDKGDGKYKIMGDPGIVVDKNGIVLVKDIKKAPIGDNIAQNITIEEFGQNFIKNVRGSGTMTGEFQEKSESEFNQLGGATGIWNMYFNSINSGDDTKSSGANGDDLYSEYYSNTGNVKSYNKSDSTITFNNGVIMKIDRNGEMKKVN